MLLTLIGLASAAGPDDFTCQPGAAIKRGDSGGRTTLKCEVHGVAQGPNGQWFSDGSPMLLGEHSDGQRHGPWIRWDKDGSVKSQGIYIRGEHHGWWWTGSRHAGSEVLRDPTRWLYEVRSTKPATAPAALAAPDCPEDAILAAGICVLRNASGRWVRHGPAQLPGPGSAIRAEVTWANGELAGPATWYFPPVEGVECCGKQRQGGFKEGERSGTWTEWWPNGQTRSVTHYVAGRRDGLLETFFEDGRPRTRIRYAEDVRCGESEHWDATGDKHVQEADPCPS